MGPNNIIFVNLDSIVEQGQNSDFKFRYQNTLDVLEGTARLGYTIVLYSLVYSNLRIEPILKYLKSEFGTSERSSIVWHYHMVSRRHFPEMVETYINGEIMGLLIDGATSTEDGQSCLLSKNEMEYLTSKYPIVCFSAEDYITDDKV